MRWNRRGRRGGGRGGGGSRNRRRRGTFFGAFKNLEIKIYFTLCYVILFSSMIILMILRSEY
jgi:hypothetical protein